MSVELPKDAEGREIPLDTTVLYDKDGNEIEVSRYQYYPKVGPGYWNLRSVRNKYYRTDEVYVNPPDSWEKLEDDLNRVVENNDAFYAASCAYMNQSGAVCNDCRLHGRHTRNCTEEMFKDVVSRIRKLKGED
ncbi:hypothetical protein [Collinsella sp. CM84Y_54]|uniref:hypothetical protein n=1 Tax=Collinsella sp. CM84Y_54 TaxID=3085309 RepID=UPI002E7A318A|nr:hypothetical protein [Collinsella sp. CM84Y_54]